MDGNKQREPLAAYFHFIPRINNKVQRRIVDVFRTRLERSPHWVLLTTRGRKTGLPREILLPCTRTGDDIIVISTYGTRSDWFRNLAKTALCEVTAGGKRRAARAEIVDDLRTRQRLVSEHPFFAAWPSSLTNALLRSVLPWGLRRWVLRHPVVVLHLQPDR